MIYIPTTTLEWLHVATSFLPPEATSAVGFGEAIREIRTPLQWQPLAPGEVLEKAGEVGAEVPACRDGCPAGTVALRASFGSAHGAGIEGLAADHVLPIKMSAFKDIQVAPPATVVVPVIERDARTKVKLNVIGVRTVSGKLKARVELQNRTAQPLWVRRLEKMVAYCDFEGQGVGRPGSGATTVWDGEDLVLVLPERTLKGEVECGVNQPSAGAVKVTLTPTEGAILQRQRPLVPPLVWTGSTQSEAFMFGPRPNP